MRNMSDMRSRWGEHFDGLLNCKEEMETELSCLGRGEVGSERKREVNTITEDEMLKTLYKTKKGRSEKII